MVAEGRLQAALESRKDGSLKRPKSMRGTE